MGSSKPPQLLTTKIKNTTMGARHARWELALSSGRINNMLAPVVPSRFANTAPAARISVFNFGVAEKLPPMEMPPAITNKLNSKIINGTYSSSPCFAAVAAASTLTWLASHVRAANPSTQLTNNLLLLRSHQCSTAEIMGAMAMQSSSTANGTHPTIHVGRAATSEYRFSVCADSPRKAINAASVAATMAAMIVNLPARAE